MATIAATPGSASFGRIVDISNSPYSFTEAHHCGVDRSGRVSRAFRLRSVSMCIGLTLSKD
jgi:hypothetical protein